MWPKLFWNLIRIYLKDWKKSRIQKRVDPIVGFHTYNALICIIEVKNGVALPKTLTMEMIGSLWKVPTKAIVYKSSYMALHFSQLLQNMKLFYWFFRITNNIKRLRRRVLFCKIQVRPWSCRSYPLWRRWIRSDNFETTFGILGFFQKRNEQIRFFCLSNSTKNKFFLEESGVPKTLLYIFAT